ncbi:MAG: hypothetical protein GY906_34045 [bacterium]|nr:hypothetical protein [bacterium]
MKSSQFMRVATIIVIGTVAVTLSLMIPSVIAAGPKHEYKFVRVVDEGAMPTITEALNREADSGWELEEMTVVPGEPGSIYLVFSK